MSCPDCGGVSSARGDGVPYRSKRFRDRDNLGASAERTGRRTYAIALGGEVRLLLPSHFAHFVGGKHRSNFESGPFRPGFHSAAHAVRPAAVLLDRLATTQLSSDPKRP